MQIFINAIFDVKGKRTDCAQHLYLLKMKNYIFGGPLSYPSWI